MADSKISFSKHAMIFLRRFIISLSRFNGIIEMTKINGFAIDSNFCLPFVTVLMNTFVKRCTVALSFICLILRVGANPQITTLIIKFVSVYMVGLKTIWSIYNKSMHKDILRPTNKLMEIRGSIPMSITPLKVIQVIKHIIIDKRYKALRQFNFFHRNLQNKIPVISWVKHETTGRIYFNTLHPA